MRPLTQIADRHITTNHSTHSIKRVHQLDMLRLRLSGVKGTPAQLSRLLEPWGIRIDRKTIAKWGSAASSPP